MKKLSTLYQVEGSKDKLPFRKLVSVLRGKGYKGAEGPYWIAAWVGVKGRALYEWRGNKRYVVGKKNA